MAFDPAQMDVIDRRRVEAMVLGPILREFQDEIGAERTNEIARAAITKLAREQGAEFAKMIGSNGVEDHASNKDDRRRHADLEIDHSESN